MSSGKNDLAADDVAFGAVGITAHTNMFMKKYSAVGTMDELRKVFERELMNSVHHEKNVQRIEGIVSSSGQISFENLFIELGKPDIDLKKTRNLDSLLKQLVTLEKVNLPEDDKLSLFRQWDEVIRRRNS